ncbi:unnamed protein product, partial [Meganyctiphanes norvegica]
MHSGDILIVTRDATVLCFIPFIFVVLQLPLRPLLLGTPCPVPLYITEPLWCYRCQDFGHRSDRCEKPAVCAKCNMSDHDDKACRAAKTELCCHSCKGIHPMYPRTCPKFCY